MSSKAQFNIWVAEDPTQPGTAFAFHSDRDDFRLFVQEWREEMLSSYNAPTRLIERELGREMLDRWDRTKSLLCQVVETACSCGEAFYIEHGRFDLNRADGKRPHYRESAPNTTALRCRKCSGWLGETCAAASFGSHSLSSNI